MPKTLDLPEVQVVDIESNSALHSVAEPETSSFKRSVSRRKTLSSQAILSLVLGVLGVFCFPFGIGAMVVGWSAYSQIKDRRNQQSGEGLAVSGITLGVLGIVVAIVGLATLPDHDAASKKPPTSNGKHNWRSADASDAARREVGKLLDQKEQIEVRFGIEGRIASLPPDAYDVETLGGQRYRVSGRCRRYIQLGGATHQREQVKLTRERFVATVHQVERGKWELQSFSVEKVGDEKLFTSSKSGKGIAESGKRIGSTRNVLGRWSNRYLGNTTRLTLFERGGEFFIEQSFSDGSELTHRLKSRPGRRYDNVSDNRFGEYYVIDGSGDLEVWDQDGLVYTATQL